ncbi:MAG: hypothetical protein HOG79_07100, partial [Prolixibacteraceae bacterium]|nr:hypothetical protein [Prolixibacteraceae bacterium]
MKKFQLIISSFLIFISQAFAQTDFQISLSNSFLGSTTKQLPFWLSANRDGKINPFVSLLNYSELSANVYSPVKTQNNLQYFAGVGVVGGLGNKNYLQLNRLFAGTAYKGWKIEAGMFYDSLRFDGLSTSNGNLARSRNARPYPKVRLSTNSFKPIPFLKKWLSFSFEYDEGILNDERYITRAHLHHKSFYLKTNRVAGFYLQAGIEHFVMWGGTSPDEIIGDLPSDFNSYLYYISGSKGNSDFPQMDQNNIAGNQYGTYQFLISKNFSEYSASINISHPFDDFSGLNWRNWPDNLIGLNIKRNKPDKFIN